MHGYELHEDNTVRWRDRVVGKIVATGRFWDGHMDGASVNLAPCRQTAFERLVKAAVYRL